MSKFDKNYLGHEFIYSDKLALVGYSDYLCEICGIRIEYDDVYEVYIEVNNDTFITYNYNL